MLDHDSLPRRPRPRQRRRWVFFSSLLVLDVAPIYVSTVSDLHDAHNNVRVGHGIDNAVWTLADTILIVPGQLLAAPGARVFGERLDAGENAEAIFLRESFDFLGGGRLDEKPIAFHVSADP
jgi:hypothetical protein